MIDQAHLLSASQRQAQRLIFINEITKRALTGASPKQILDRLASKAIEILAADGCYITRWDDERQVPVPFTADGPESNAFMDAATDLREVQLSQAVLASGHAGFIDGFAEAFLDSPGRTTRAASQVILALPLKIGEQNLGAVLIKYRQPHPYFFKKDISGWEEISSQISLAIGNVLSIENEKQRRKEAELLQQATFAITSSLNLQEVLNYILVGMEQAVPYDSAAISLIEGDYLKIAALGGSSRHTHQIGEIIAKSTGLFLLLESSRSPVVLGDAQMHPNYDLWSEDGKDLIHGWMGVPLIAYDRPIGFLTLNSQEQDIYTAAHARLAQSFANQAALAIENARLFEQVRNGRERLQMLSKRLVEIQESERRLIAHELHDEIGQVLTGLQFILSMGKEGPEANRQRAFSEAQGLVSTLMSQIRELSLNLHPAMLDDLGLLPAFKSHFERYRQQTGIQVHFEQKNMDRRFPPEVELSVFRLVQETLTNVARYAGVKDVDIAISADHASLYIRVEDHGHGFDLDILSDGERSFGLTGIRERTYMVGGKFAVYSKTGEGTRIEAIFPIGGKVERRGYDRQGIVGG